MLKRFEVKNYKNFKENIVIDFGAVGGYQFNSECFSSGILGKMLIYGRNATGKTNLGKALMDICNIECCLLIFRKLLEHCVPWEEMI